MTNAYKSLHDAGFWDTSDLPTKPQYRLLEHLVQEGDPRLYVQFTENGFVHQAGVSNSAHAVYGNGNVYCSLDGFITGGYDNKCHPWVDVDEEGTTKYRGRRSYLKVFKINNKGREAMAQYLARKRYIEEVPTLVKRLLLEARLKTGARSKK